MKRLHSRVEVEVFKSTDFLNLCPRFILAALGKAENHEPAEILSDDNDDHHDGVRDFLRT